MTLRRHSEHRLQMPTVQRHGYCSYGRNDDPFKPLDHSVRYCFCNDWNGCNAAPAVRGAASVSVGLALSVALVTRTLLL